MTIFTHVICGLTLSTMLGFPYWMGIIFSIAPDIDHVLLINRFPKKMEANCLSSLRSPFHELIGIVIVSSISSILIAFNLYSSVVKFFLLCYTAHLFLDFLIGKSYPFRYINSEFESCSISYFNSYAEKVIVEILFVSFLLLILQIYRGQL